MILFKNYRINSLENSLIKAEIELDTLSRVTIDNLYFLDRLIYVRQNIAMIKRKIAKLNGGI